jgi:plastocyanin
VQIAVRDNVFEPPFVEVRAGTLVRWHNQGRDDHDVVAEDSSFESPVLRPGEAYERVFDSPGSFPYLCDLHDNMTATIVVR